MLKSDRRYLARFSLDPEMEFDDIELYFDDENEKLTEDWAPDSIFERQADDSFFDYQDEVEDQ